MLFMAKMKNKKVYVICLFVFVFWVMLFAFSKYIFYSVSKYNTVEWSGACKNELLIIKSRNAEYTLSRGGIIPWLDSRFGEEEMWLYKYDLDTWECLFKKNIKKKSRSLGYVSGFVLDGKKLFLSNCKDGKESCVVYDVDTMKEIEKFDAIANEPMFFESEAYYRTEKVAGDEQRETFLVWNGNDDVFVNKHDVDIMNSNNTGRMIIKDSTSGLQKMSDKEGMFEKYSMVYNSKDGEREFVVDVYDYKDITYTLLDHKTRAKIGSISSKDIGHDFCFNFYCCGDTFYNVKQYSGDDVFHFFRYNFADGKSEEVVLPDR